MEEQKHTVAYLDHSNVDTEPELAGLGGVGVLDCYGVEEWDQLPARVKVCSGWLGPGETAHCVPVLCRTPVPS